MLFLELEVTIFTIHNCWPGETISKLIQSLGKVCGAGSAHRIRATKISSELYAHKLSRF